MKTTLAVALLLMALRPALAEDSVVTGKMLEDKHLDHITIACPENAICMHSWWRSVIDVGKTVGGAKLSGRVAVASLRHAGVNSRFRQRLSVFVLRPIESPEARADFRADYYLQDLSAPHQMYCLSRDPKEAALVPGATYVPSDAVSKRYCFELPEEERD